MKYIMLAACMFCAGLTLNAQLNGLVDRAKAKAKQRIANRIDQGMDKALDQLEKPATPRQQPASALAAAPVTGAQPSGNTASVYVSE